jgi:ribosomal protein L11 methyltransferase
MCSLVANRLAPDGDVILSGIVEWNRDKVLATYEHAGFRKQSERQSDEWITILLKKDHQESRLS